MFAIEFLFLTVIGGIEPVFNVPRYMTRKEKEVQRGKGGKAYEGGGYDGGY